MIHRRAFTVAVAAMLLVVVGGCASETPGVYPVEGTVHYTDGTPLSQGVIYFQSDENLLMADIQEDGAFALKTGGVHPGAPPGEYTIYFGAGGGDDYATPEPIVAPKYRSPEQSDIVREVKAEANRFEIEVERP